MKESSETKLHGLRRQQKAVEDVLSLKPHARSQSTHAKLQKKKLSD
jgi:hypothetical protein